jgi:hypothetical protein
MRARSLLLSMMVGIGMLLVGRNESRGESASPELSVARRELLWERYRDWMKLSDVDRSAITTLHQQIQESGSTGEHLRSSLERYDRWLVTLSPTERARIIGAASNQERLERVKEILQKQTLAMDESLFAGRPSGLVSAGSSSAALSEVAPSASTDAPSDNSGSGTTANSRASTADRPGPGRRPLFTRQRFDVVESEMQRLDEMEELFTEEERRRLDTARGGKKVPMMMALATKYALPIPPFVEEGQTPILQFFMGLLPDPEGVVGTKSAAMLSEENKKKLGAIVVDLMMLPDLSEDKQFVLLQSEAADVRSGLEEISKVNKTTSRFLTNVLYHLVHPKEAPESTKDSLALISVEHLRRVITTGRARLSIGRPARPDSGNRNDRPVRTPTNSR